MLENQLVILASTSAISRSRWNLKIKHFRKWWEGCKKIYNSIFIQSMEEKQEGQRRGRRRRFLWGRLGLGVQRAGDSFLMTADSAMSYPSYVNPQVLTMFNVSTLLNQKDSRWLQLEVCREFQRQKCTRSDAECKFAHPPPNVEVQNGRVTACYDSIKVRVLRVLRWEQL